jgi:hypothetical protein
MPFILWRPTDEGTEEYVTGWAAKGGAASFSRNAGEAQRYETQAAAEGAIAKQAPAGWRVREIGRAK